MLTVIAVLVGLVVGTLATAGVAALVELLAACRSGGEAAKARR